MGTELAPDNRIKPQMTCLKCCRVWEQGRARVGQPSRASVECKYLSRCPICQSGLFDAGRDFKAPRRSDLKQWRKVAVLLRAGFRFTRYNSRGPQAQASPTPKYLREVEAFLTEREWAARTQPDRQAAAYRAQELTHKWSDAARAREWKRIEKQARRSSTRASST